MLYTLCRKETAESVVNLLGKNEEWGGKAEIFGVFFNISSVDSLEKSSPARPFGHSLLKLLCASSEHWRGDVGGL